MTLASTSQGAPARETTTVHVSAANWGTGYYAEGARGSSGWNPGAGDRAAVERALKGVSAGKGSNESSD